jgi:hypothetical protein
MAFGPPVVRHRSFSGWHARIARRCPGRMSEQPGLLTGGTPENRWMRASEEGSGFHGAIRAARA